MIKNCIFILALFSFLVSCTTSPLNKMEMDIVQIYKVTQDCNLITTIAEENKWNGSFKDVKSRLKKSTYLKGGNTFMIDKVEGGRRRTTAFVYYCSNIKPL